MQDEIERLQSDTKTLATGVSLVLAIDDNKLKGLSWPELIKWYVGVKNGMAAIEAEYKRLYHYFDRINKFVIPERLGDEGLDKVRVPELGLSVYPLKKLSCSVVDYDKATEWLRANGGEGLIKETVNASSLSSFVGNKIKEEGIDPPEDAIKVNTYTITGTSNYTPKK